MKVPMTIALLSATAPEISSKYLELARGEHSFTLDIPLEKINNIAHFVENALEEVKLESEDYELPTLNKYSALSNNGGSFSEDTLNALTLIMA